VTAEKTQDHVDLGADDGARGAALYCQYQMFISPDTVSGIAVSLQMVFAVIVGGGLLCRWDPRSARSSPSLLAEILRISFGTKGGRLGQPRLRRIAGAVHHIPSQGHSW